MRNLVAGLLVAVWMFTLTACGGGGGTSVPVNNPPVVEAPLASFKTSVITGVAPLAVDFTDTSTKVPTSWHWNFGDGASSTLQNPTHTFTVAGTYTVALAISNEKGGSSANYVMVVTDAPVSTPAPVANFSVNVATGIAPLLISFTDSSTKSPASWLWNFGDGVTSVLQNPTHTYLTAGIYTASLTVANAGGSTSKSIVFTVEAAPTQPVLLPVPADEFLEKVTVLVNKSGADGISNVANGAAAVISEVSAVFAKTTKKRYVMDNFQTYADDQITSITSNPAFFKDNAYSSNPKYGGTTLVYYFYKNQDRSDLPALFKEQENIIFTTSTSSNGKIYGLIYVADQVQYSELNGRAIIELRSPTMFDSNISMLCHELGHTLGLGVPEWYGMNFQDNSGTLPNLGAYSLNSSFPKDPMTSQGLWKGNEFGSYNSWFIDHNANHQFNGYQLSVNMGRVIKVKVVDALGNPMVGAVVKSYGALSSRKNNDWSLNYYIQSNMTFVLQDLVTDSNGLATINNDDFIEFWLAKGIKAWSGSKSGGAYLTSLDLEEAQYRYGLVNEYVLTIIVK